jgi:protein SCO1/2
MNRGFPALIALCAGLLLTGIWRVAYRPESAPSAPPAIAEEGIEWRGKVPNVPLVTQDGRTVHLYDDLLKGHLVALNFFYIECQGTCPGVTSTLVDVERGLRNQLTRELRIVSISLQPERDTPEQLRDYATRYGAGPGMVFLTGRPEQVDLVRRALGFAHPEDPARDLDRKRHAALLRLGNEAEGWWASCPSLTTPAQVMNVLRSLDRPPQGGIDLPPRDFPGGVPVELQSASDLPALQDFALLMERLEGLWMSRIPMDPAPYRDLILSQLCDFLHLSAEAAERFRADAQASLKDLAGARKKMEWFRMEKAYDPDAPESLRTFRSAWRAYLEDRSRAFARIEADLTGSTRAAILREQTVRWMGYLEDLPDAVPLHQDEMLTPIRKK